MQNETTFIHLTVNESGGSYAEYCLPADKAQFYIEKFEAAGCSFAGAADCNDPDCPVRAGDDRTKDFFIVQQNEAWVEEKLARLCHCDSVPASPPPLST